MQIAQLEQYGVPVWNVSPLAKNLLVRLKTILRLSIRQPEHGLKAQINLKVCLEFLTMISTKV